MKPTVLKFATKQSVRDIATKTSPRSTKTICEILESFFTTEVYIVILGVGLLQGNPWNSYDFSQQQWCQARFRCALRVLQALQDLGSPDISGT